METSNIVAGSNVFLSRKEHPFWDSEFVKQVQDYKLVKYIDSRRRVDGRVCELSEKQYAILQTEMRCVYAKNDPCWGYSDAKKKVISACINGECPNIRRCNPLYSSEVADLWRMSDEERDLYGNPMRLRKYYIVDMISDEEMLQYESNPGNDGREFSVKNPVLPDKKIVDKKDEIFRIEERTGRKMVVVGHKWMITDMASYENEELVPIWGYADEVNAKRIMHRRKAPKITQLHVEKKDTSANERLLDVSEQNETNNRKFSSIKDYVYSTVSIGEIEKETFEAHKTVIICANEAECSYISSMLIKNSIEHGFKNCCDVRLVSLSEQLSEECDGDIWVTSTVISDESIDLSGAKWKFLISQKKLTQLQLVNRDYYELLTANYHRWCCRNMYGVTHICFIEEDIEYFEATKDGAYSISLVEDGDSYIMLRADGLFIGRTTKGFVGMLEELIKVGEIAGKPTVIEGISIQVSGGEKEVQGIGHMKFWEY
ncbi:MAG: hypothetical protein IJ353_06980 [Lachnospiraceae bacterium]|nr:hypothetical protein [Lachnospiraceae bacterium]